MLKATIIGNLGNDPDMRYAASGSPMLRFNVASNYRTRASDGEQHMNQRKLGRAEVRRRGFGVPRDEPFHLHAERARHAMRNLAERHATQPIQVPTRAAQLLTALRTRRANGAQRSPRHVRLLASARRAR